MRDLGKYTVWQFENERGDTVQVKFLTVRWNNIFSIVLLCVTVFFVIAVLAGANVPLAGGGISSFITLVVIGGIGCGLSEGQSIMRSVRHKQNTGKSTYLKRHPLTIIGEVLGIFALLLIILTFYGRNIGFITGYSMAFLVLAVIIFVLFGLNLRRNKISIT